MFELTDKPIVIRALTSADQQAGGWVTFEGRVRSVNEGKEVTGLEYEIYESLAIKEGTRILTEAREKYGLLEVYAIHRFGILALGDTAIWVTAAAMHRREAFEAAEYIVHTIKHTLPIWKKETYADGSAQWVGCQHEHSA